MNIFMLSVVFKHLKNKYVAVSCAAAVLFFLIYAVFNALYPWRGDDFLCHYMARSQTPFEMISDSYFNWTLRFGNVVCAFIECCQSKTLFNILNSLVQTALIWLICAVALDRKPDICRRDDALALLFAAGASVFVCRPADTVYWVPGAVLYSWAAVVYLACWLVLRKIEKQGANCSAGKLLLLVVLGFCSGYANENVALAGVLLLTVRSFFKPSKPLFFTLAGVISGAVFLFTTPGTVKRVASVAGQNSQLTVSGMFAKIPEIAAFYIASSLIPLVILFVVLMICFRKTDRRSITAAAVSMGLSLFAALVFAGCPLPPMRSYYVCSLLVILSSCILFCRADISGKKRLFTASGAVAAGILMLLCAFPDFIMIYQDEVERHKLIAEQKLAGAEVVCVPEHRVLRRSFLQYIFIEDMAADPEFWLNRNAALYFDVKKIRVIPGGRPVTPYRQIFLKLTGTEEK